MNGVLFFHNFGVLIRSNHTLHWCPYNFAILRNGRSSYGTRVFPGFDRQKVAKKKFLCSNVQSFIKVLSKKICGLLMFSDFGKLHVHVSTRKKPLYSSWGVSSKIMIFILCKLLKKGLRPGQPFPSGLQSLSRKLLIRWMVTICLVRCNVNCKE